MLHDAVHGVRTGRVAVGILDGELEEEQRCVML